MISRIDHISLAVRDFEKASDFFTKVLGAIPQTHGRDKRLKYYWEIFTLGDLSRVELLKSLGDDSFLSSFLSKREGGIHHLNLETPDIERTKKMLDDQKIPYFGYAAYGDAWKELFIHPKHGFGVLIQIAEFRPDDWLAPSSKMVKDRKWMISKKNNEYELAFKHPGGGKVLFKMDKKEIINLVNELKTLIED